MNKSRSSSLRASAAASVALIAGSFLATAASATSQNPQPIAPGMSATPVPVYGSTASNFQSSPSGTQLAYCTDSACTTGSLTVFQIADDLDGGYVEVAGTTNLNPFGADDVTLAFAIGTFKSVASVELPDFSTWSADVQACDPNLGIPCPSTNSGANASRDTMGNITFSATSTAGLPTQNVDGIVMTDVYAIYTNAPISALMDPNALLTFTDGSTESVAAFGFMPQSTGTVPEPSVLALLAAGLATLGLAMGLRRRSR